jgi:1-acyl-sn-glycerol-3-phosphate acyltransferase
VGKPVKPPKSSSRDDLNAVTMHLQNKINSLIG